MNKLDILSDIINNQQYKKVKENGKSILIDMMTANAIMKVYNHLKLKQKEKYINLSWAKMVNFAWKVLK